MVAPGVRYRAIHEGAARRMLQGLVDLRIFRGAVDGLAERGAHLVGDRARQDVVGAARRQWNDQRDRPVRIGLCARGRDA